MFVRSLGITLVTMKIIYPIVEYYGAASRVHTLTHMHPICVCPILIIQQERAKQKVGDLR